jgi:hypothetical protein
MYVGRRKSPNRLNIFLVFNASTRTMNTKKLTLAIVLVAAAALMIASSLTGTVLATKIQVCPGGQSPQWKFWIA